MTNINMSTYLLRLFSRDLQDLSTDDENSYVETQGLLNTLYINSVIFAVLMTFYEMNRHMRSIYLKRLTSKFKVSYVDLNFRKLVHKSINSSCLFYGRLISLEIESSTNSSEQVSILLDSNSITHN